MTPEDCARSRCPRECLRTSADQLRVHLGVSDRTEAGAEAVSVAVTRIIIHPGWDKLHPLNNITHGHDLAVLELATPVKFRFIPLQYKFCYLTQIIIIVTQCGPSACPPRGMSPY